jgi:hypothetical protein
MALIGNVQPVYTTGGASVLADLSAFGERVFPEVDLSVLEVSC